FSQNARQVGDGSYSFTKFDVLGRTIEVGQAILQTGAGETFANIPTQAQGTYTDFELTSFPTLNTSQETYTVYTDAATQINYLGAGQEYLRNRVSYTFSNGMDGNKSVSYFSYDPHGNVEWIVQELPGIGKSSVGYEYDLISNKVTKVKLNEDRTDQFFHRYTYDADNRITMVETSPNNFLWDRDASYSYYKHGPLRRTQIGEDHVQGLDYTYTLHGWLKALNAPTLTATDDPGQDGVSSSPYQKDEYGFVLGYYGPQTSFNGDFKRTGSIFNNAPTAGTSTATDLSSSKPLYNGNITSWSTRINAEASGFQVTGNTYTYDFLNRIKSSTFSKQSGSSAFSAVTDYATTYKYDGNGNLCFLKRNGAGGTLIDSLTYKYNNITVSGVNTKSNNQLLYITDPAGAVGDDIGNQSTGNYTYDGIGNLTSDQSANTIITWNVYGKVDQVKQKVPSTTGKPELRFVYDAMGNRVEKEENLQPYDGSLNPQRLLDQLVTTYYVRDASGNVMAIYQRHNAALSGQPGYYTATYTIKEIPLYGSSRVGVQDERDQDVVVATKIFYKDDYYKVNFEFNLEDQKTEMNNWLTVASTTDVLGSSNLSSIGLHQVDFNTTVPHAQALTNIQNFAGLNGKDVNVAENDYGQPLFYTATMARYWGKRNVLLLFDGNGNLMPNSGGILADSNARTVIVQSPVSSSQYLLFTRNAVDHKLYYHIIDLTLQGNGTSKYDKRGDVQSKNIAVDASNTYGTHLMAIEDRGAGKAYLYATQYKAPADATLAIGTTQLTLFEVSNTGTSLVKTPSNLCAQISSWEDVAQSQLQVSPDGKKITMINHQQNMGWFAAQKTQAIIFNAGANYRLASNLIVNATIVPIGISMPHQSSDFSADSRYIYYSQQRLTPKLAYNTMGRFDLRNSIQSANLFLNQLPQIQRSKTGFVYAYQSTNLWNAYDETTTGTSQAEPTDNLTFSYLASGNTISNYMSVQNRILYKLNDLSLLFSRRVGKKNYELSDHLGNVTVVVSDELSSDPLNSYANKADVETYTGYYAFGMAMPGRSLNSSDYRYGFNGKEKDVNGLGGGGSTYDYGFRIYNPQIAKFLSVDPLAKKYTSESNYIYAGNSPVVMIDEGGKKKTWYIIKIDENGNKTVLTVVEKYKVKQYTEYSSESVGVGGNKLFTSPVIANEVTYDLEQTLTIDSKGNVTVGEEKQTNIRSNKTLTRYLEDNSEEMSERMSELFGGGGGIVFTSETIYPGNTGADRKGKQGKADVKEENIDLLMAVIGAAGAAATSEKATTFIKGVKQILDATTIGHDLGDELGVKDKPQTDSCTYCGNTGTHEEMKDHANVVPIEDKK
ncbi:MAG TPA: RHS repeat-associated core domain-containing protein, partial [Cytophagaceae bacterium]|nr:RHS repeat-associated core domain-containing protein [Cytophagaceae bacterium]